MLALFTNNVLFSNLNKQVRQYFNPHTHRMIELNKILPETTPFVQLFLSKRCFHLKQQTKIMEESVPFLGWMVYTCKIFFSYGINGEILCECGIFSPFFNRFQSKFTFSKLKYFSYYLSNVVSFFVYTFQPPPHPHTPTFKQSIYIFVYTMYNVRRCKYLKKESDMYRFILCLKCVFVLNETMLVHCHNSIFILKRSIKTR